MDPAAYLIKSALSDAEIDLASAVASARDRAHRAALNLSQLRQIQEMYGVSKQSPVSTGLRVGIPAALAASLPGYLLGGGRGAAIGAGIGTLLGGGLGATLPGLSRRGLQEMAQGEPGEFETKIAPSGMPQAFGDPDEIIVETKLRRRNKRLVRELLGL